MRRGATSNACPLSEQPRSTRRVSARALVGLVDRPRRILDEAGECGTTR